MNLSSPQESLNTPNGYNSRLRLGQNESSFLENTFLKKIIFLLASTLCLTGNYYAYDLPAALNRQLKTTLNSDPEHWQIQLAILYSAYSLPNIILPYFTARFVDKLGSRTSIVLFSSLVVVGQYLVAFGLESNFFTLMVFGRVLLGIGGESIGIAQARITCRWFQDAQLGFALSANLGFARLGSVLTDILSPYIVTLYDTREGTFQASWFGFWFCVVSALCAIFLALLDLFFGSNQSVVAPVFHSRSNDVCPDFEYDNESSLLIRQATNPSFYGTTKSSKMCSRSALPTFWVVPSDPDPLNTNVIEDPLDNTSKLIPVDNRRKRISFLSDKSYLSESGSFFHSKNFQLRNVLYFGPLYWLISLIIICYYGSIIPFTNIASDLLQEKWYYNQPVKSGVVLSIPDFFSTLLVPLFSYLLSNSKYRLWLTALCGIGVAIVHTLIALSSEYNPLTLMISLGLFYALLASSLWSCIPLLVPDNLLILAYSTSTCLLNTILALGPLAVALLINKDPSYCLLELVLAALALVGGILTFYTIWYIFHNETFMLPSDLEEAIADDYEPIEEDADIGDGDEFRRLNDSTINDGKSNYVTIYGSPVDNSLDPQVSPCSFGIIQSHSISSHISSPIPMAGFPGGYSKLNTSQESLLTRQLLNSSLTRSGSACSVSKFHRSRNVRISNIFSSNNDLEASRKLRRSLFITSSPRDSPQFVTLTESTSTQLQNSASPPIPFNINRQSPRNDSDLDPSRRLLLSHSDPSNFALYPPQPPL